jgi:hypothetical protein
VGVMGGDGVGMELADAEFHGILDIPVCLNESEGKF